LSMLPAGFSVALLIMYLIQNVEMPMFVFTMQGTIGSDPAHAV